MAINILSGNLNTYGDSGQFEADRSTWGFTSSQLGLERSSVQKSKGLYSCGATGILTGPFTYLQIARGYYASFTPGKKYFARAKVYVDNTTPIAVDTLKFEVSPLDTATWFTITSKVRKTVLEARGAWVDLECYMIMGGASVLPSLVSVFLIAASNAQSDNVSVNSGGKVWVDELELFEYEDVVIPCTLAIDIPGTVVTHETAPAAGDGSITVATTGGVGTLEYSKNGGATWQSSNQFLGLADGVYDIRVREVATISCTAAQTFAVNESAYTFSFTISKTDESVSGAANGAIEITVTGTLAPFDFSKDGGATWQLGNIFTGLAAGTYTIVVRDDNNILRSQNVTIEPGIILFEKAWWSRNPITQDGLASAGWELLDNFRMYDDVRVEEVADSANYISNLKVHLTPFTNGTVTFQVREAFRKILTATPPNGVSTITRLTDRIKAFKHFTGEVSGVNETPGTLTDSAPQVVLLGGLSKYKFAEIDFFGTYLPTNKKFLTWAPIEKPVDRNQDDYLNYFVFGALTTQLKQRITCYYDDNTTQTSVVETKSGVVYGHLYQIPAGPANSGALLVNPAKNLLKYDLSLLDQSDAVISEVRTYVLDAYTHPRKRLFMFLNSLGSYEILRFTGQSETQVEIGKEEIVKFLPIAYEQADGEREVNSAVSRFSGNYSTGFFEQKNASEWLDYMQDFLLSKRVFLIQGSNLVPVVVQGGSYALNADQVYEKAIRFTALNSYQEENYTPENI